MVEWEKSNWKWYIIKNWKVSVKIWWQEVAVLWKWDIFWEIALLNEEERLATIEALTQLEVIVLNQENLLEMIENDDNTINKSIMKRIEENLKINS